MKKLTLLGLSLALSLPLFSCSKHEEQAPVVLGMQQTQVPAPHLAVNADKELGSDPKAPAVVTEITLAKSELLGRSFLYGSSLQFSSLVQDEIQTSLMAIALGHAPATFRIIDNKLQLMADQSINFESDVNHPARLVHEFPILRQNAKTVTIRADKASPVLAGLLFGPNSPAERSSWIRSLEFVGDKNLLMIESTIETADGSIAEFMETIMPRESLVPAGYKPLFADVSLSDAAARYRFLDAGKVWMNVEDAGRIQTAVAQRFLLKGDEPVRWFVTKNAPKEYLDDLKHAVEGWNRYSQRMWKHDILKFEGYLPEGVKIGDPRYNIIVWDNVQDAGAAYESQAADPTTGIQSHSLIYLPLAWINIGREYWELAQSSDASSVTDRSEQRAKTLSKLLKSRNFLGRRLPVNCIEDAAAQISVESRVDPETFARELLKGTLFHEVGHALGLAHNFKGSLAFDADDDHSIFSSSIMDYNHYNEEGAAFDSVDSGSGPLLEYDRQIVSVLYNEGKDVADTDPVLPACDDTEADSLDGGVDPLCVRYDIGKDPTKLILRSIELLTNENAKKGRMKSLPLALRELPGSLPAAESVTELRQAAAAVNKLAGAAKGVSNIYIGGSANSIAYLGSQVALSLHVFRDGALPEGYSEHDMRARTIQAVNAIAAMEQLPAPVANEFERLSQLTREWLLRTPAVQAQADREAVVTKLMAPMNGAKALVTKTVLAKMRARVLGALTYSATAPFYLEKTKDGTLDLESYSVSLLEKSLMSTADGAARLFTERAALAKALASFAATEEGLAAIQHATGAISEEIRQSSDAISREQLRSLLAILSGK